MLAACAPGNLSDLSPPLLTLQGPWKGDGMSLGHWAEDWRRGDGGAWSHPKTWGLSSVDVVRASPEMPLGSIGKSGGEALDSDGSTELGVLMGRWERPAGVVLGRV